LLGTVAFISTGFLPIPVDKMFVMIQALTFALGSLMMAGSGGAYASLINGILLSILRTGFFPFSLIFSLFYGLLIDGFFQAFKVRKDNYVKSAKTGYFSGSWHVNNWFSVDVFNYRNKTNADGTQPILCNSSYRHPQRRCSRLSDVAHLEQVSSSPRSRNHLTSGAFKSILSMF
jgi:hypothetical protein